MVWNLHQVSNTFLKGNISSSHIISPLSACSLLLLVHLASFKFFFFLSSLFPDLYNKHLLRSEKSRNDKTGLALSDSLSSLLFSFSIFKVLAPTPPVSWQPPCPHGMPPRPLDHIRALLSSSLQFTLATSGWCRTVLLLHLWASCSPGSKKYRHAPKPASTKTDTSR